MESPEEQPHGYGDSTSFPDLMNDPAYATNSGEKGKKSEDPDTCRICRGEGSEDEQLFYPCKCSGSIKFVHQACLVEWLSHSQKKYCELCKTPFRFTKLYDPNMPRELPAPLFIKQALAHTIRTLTTWLRFGLVVFVWLGWLPWSMRAIWRALFWLADGRWPGGENPQRTAAGNTFNGSAIDATVTATSLASSTAAQTAAIPLPSSAQSIFSFSAGEPIMLTLIKKVLSILFYPGLSSSMGPMDSGLTDSTTRSFKQRQPSWLSDVKFLNSLTPSPTFNNILIDTLEGQLITLLVVITFILVFLIREWVVQQQPMANIADGERDAAVQLIANNRQNEPVEAPQPEPEHALQPETPIEPPEEHVENTSEYGDEGPRGAHFGTAEGTFDIGDARLESPDNSPMFPRSNMNDPESSDYSSGQLSPRFNRTWPGSGTFSDLWARGNEDPEEVLRIIRDEGRQDELEWVTRTMRRLQQSGLSQASVGHTHPAEAGSSSSSHVYANDAASDLIDRSILASENFPESSPATILDGQWHSTSADRGHSGNSRPLQHDFAFNFPESAPNMVNPFESQPAEQAQTSSRDENPQIPTPTSVVNDVLHHGAEPSGSARQASQTDHVVAQPPKSLTDRLFDWFWGDVTPVDRPQERWQDDEERVIDDPALEVPFVPAQHNHPLRDGGIHEGQELGPDAADDGLDPNDVEAVEEGDDLEGILELIGMQGPIFGLLQNGVFSGLLISLTVAIGVWLPYLWGKIALVLLDNPVQLIFGVPMAAVSIVADVTLDTLIGSLGYVMYWASLLFNVLLSPFGTLIPIWDWIPEKSVASASLSLIDASSRRLKQGVGAFFIFHESDIPLFSVLSHQALRMHEARIAGLFRSIFTVGKFVVHDLPLRIISSGLRGALSFDYEIAGLSNALIQSREQAYSSVQKLLTLMVKTRWINAGTAKTVPNHAAVDPDLAVWNTKDRIIAIIMGYLLVSLMGFLYLRITGLISGANRGQRIEGFVAEAIHQAGGVMKVIVIIGIEMIVFPLYCGSLLDVALLPLFDKATIASRVDFTSSSPLTSLFVHWFIGTCYMFHFALFVSMCRKIMRTGVLCRSPIFD